MVQPPAWTRRETPASTSWQRRLEDPRTLGAFRIGLGLCLVGDLTSLLPHIPYFYGEGGVASACVFPRSLSLLCVLPGESWATLLIGLACLAALAFTLGIGTRISKWICALLYASVVLRSAMPNAGQQVLGNFLFLLCLSRCGAAYSLDNALRVRRLRAAGRLDGADPDHATYRTIPAWPRWLMILQLTIAYTAAGWAKTGQSYIDGSSFYYLLSNDRWYRFHPWWLLSNLGDNLLIVATWIAWWFERLFPLAALGLLLRDRFGHVPAWIRGPTSRWIWASLALVFTGTLALFANLGWFVLATAVATIVLFRGDEVGSRVDALLRRESAAPPSDRETPPAPPASAPQKARLSAVLLTLFVTWHAGTMVVNALGKAQRASLGLHSLHRITHTYGRLTNTYQFWRMFSPGVSSSKRWLLIDTIDADGARRPAFDDRTLIGARDYPYIFVDRRSKAHTNMLRREGWRRQHAAYLCARALDPGQTLPATIEFRRLYWRIPSPRRAAGTTFEEYTSRLESTRFESLLMRYSCSTGQVIDLNP